MLVRFSILFVCASLVACGGKKTEVESEEKAEVLGCETTDDCEEGMMCLASACTSAAGGAIYLDTANAVTPAKVQAELEALEERRQKRRDELLDGL